MDRRTFLRLSAAGLALPTSVLAACSDDKKEPNGTASPSATTAAALADIGATAAPGLQVHNAEAELLVNAGRLAFGLVDPQNEPVLDASVTVYAGTSADDPPRLQGDATWLTEGPIRDKGLYISELSFPSPGAWLVAVIAKTKEGASLKGGTTLTVLQTSVSPSIGQRAVSVATPTTARPLYAAPLCSRKPVCSLHALSLDEALKNGKPTVVTFATPAFCLTATCGPVVDIVEDVTANRAVNALHIEPFLNPERGLTTLTPPMNAYRFRTEPWTYFIGADGVIIDRIAGAFGTSEADERVTKLLA